MKTALPGIICVGTGLISQFGAQVHAAPLNWEEKVNSVIQQHLTEARNVGIVVGVIQNGETWTRSYGQVRLNDPTSPSDQTVFEIGSVSKGFTGLALGHLVAEGKVKLEEPIEKYLSELSGTPAGKITFRELTTHTSGLPRLPSNLNLADPTNPYKNYTLANLLEFLKDFQLEHPKPFPIQYSNLGAGLLGYVLSRISGTDYDAMIHKFITLPLGMMDTEVELSPAQGQKMAQGHNSVLEETSHWDFSLLAGAGGIRSSLHDMLIFLKANLTPEPTPLAPALKLSHQIHVAGSEDSVGLGWFIQGQERDPTIWHNGQTGGFYSLIAFKPKEQAGIVVLTNTASSLQCLSSIVFGQDCQPKKEFVHTEAQLQSFLGKYELKPGIMLEIMKPKSFLVGQATGQGKLRLSADSEGKFDIGGLAKITFLRNEKMEVDRLVLMQDGIETTAKKQVKENYL